MLPPYGLPFLLVLFTAWFDCFLRDESKYHASREIIRPPQPQEIHCVKASEEKESDGHEEA